ncbi:phosphodiester glycosidase family protein [Bacteroides congonensis]|uniref:phosphodiester glycosidase family protein n=1 Tax=Bacteroides congonensis TaxID=1871006 RepID=UPI001899349A|nr:phosphodiester glycosidase family protein [Bacteroides congonensis]
MKLTKLTITFLSAFFCLIVACGSDGDITPQIPDVTDPEEPREPDVSPVAKVPTLLKDVQSEWKIDSIDDGFIYYNYERYDDVSNANQIINVLEVDLTSNKYNVQFTWHPSGDTLSHAAQLRGAIGGVNGGYEPEAIYVRVNGSNLSEVTLPEGHLRYWKHDGAIYSDGKSDVGIMYGGPDGKVAIDRYKQHPAKFLLASAPTLIDNYKPLGETFAGDYTTEEIAKFDYEDYRNHQGVRHPRTVVVLTEDKDLLLITIDGRWPGKSEGMNAKEVTLFLKKHFNPQYALNMDGGGSTTMYVKGKGAAKTDVVNYPTDNGVFNHYGQRKVGTHIIVNKK